MGDAGRGKGGGEKGEGKGRGGEGRGGGFTKKIAQEEIDSPLSIQAKNGGDIKGGRTENWWDKTTLGEN
jgi:hypothetical protein